MARLHEHQGKRLLAEHGIAVPRGRAVADAAAAGAAAGELLAGGARRVVLKAQAWVTGRASRGGVLFASTPAEAGAQAERLLRLRFGNFPVTEVLVEEAIEDIAQELFVSLTIDDAARAPVLLLDTRGGTGIEDRAKTVTRLPVPLPEGLDHAALLAAIAESPVAPALGEEVAAIIETITEVARRCEARALEVNPLLVTGDGRVIAADCRITIDDYAVFRHPELGIEIARELDHPATELERIAYRVEQADHRGTFYFAQLPTDEREGPLIGFHGAGGGGSMMSMDAVTREGFVPANFCDTSGNPSAAKVYRAARIILAQPGLSGYFGSGSGVASQEQYHSAYGLAKAFRETDLPVPAVVRLGGNSEDRAVEILEDACRDLPGAVEGYRKDDTPAHCAERFGALVAASGRVTEGTSRRLPDFVGATDALRIPIEGGSVWIDRARCAGAVGALVVEKSAGMLELDGDSLPIATGEDLERKDSEWIACEIECVRAGHPVLFVDLEIPGL